MLNTFLYDGDIFIGNLNVNDYWWTFDEGNDRPSVSSDFVSIVLESEFNVGLRHQDKSDTPGKYLYYQFVNEVDGDSPAKRAADYIAQKYYRPTEDSFYFYPEAYLYSKAFSQLGSIVRYIPISEDYDFCSACEDTFPYRIYYSESDDIERRRDNFLTILPNNYTDIDGNSGPITDMFINFNELVVNTIYTPYIIPTNVQVLNTEDSTNVYVGSGKVFQIPPKPLKNSDVAFGGVEFWKSRVSTEYGNVWVDNKSSRPLLLSDKLNDISLNGMRNFWQENGSISFNTQYKLLTNAMYPLQSTVNVNGVGLITTYDSRHKRLIFHKKDYRILDGYTNNFTVTLPDDPVTTDFTLWFDGTNFYYNGRPGLGTSLIDITDSRFFENKSFTISYSFLTNSWVSFHSYFPYYMFNDSDSFYTDDLYKHNEGNFQTYYDIKYDHMIDLIAINNPVEAKLNTNICYASNVYEKYFDGTFFLANSTFTKGVFYNSKQSSGYQDLIVKAPFDFNLDLNQIAVTKVDNKWRLNDLRDITYDNFQPVWSKDWANTFSNYWIDKVPNNIDYMKSLFEAARFRDHYLGVRLFFNPSSNYKINTDIVQTYNVNRNR